MAHKIHISTIGKVPVGIHIAPADLKFLDIHSYACTLISKIMYFWKFPLFDHKINP